MLIIFAKNLIKVMKRLSIVLVVLFSASVFGQQDEHLSSFTMLSFTYKHNKRWSAYVELQDRGIEKFSKPDYYEVKGGIGYNINKPNQILLGVGKYGTYKNSKISQEELRVWLQYVFSHSINRFKIDHRLRLEKRFFYYPQTDVCDNTERYRYRLTVSMPINNDRIEANTFFVNAFNEIFLGPDGPTFKRNRVFSGVGYQFNNYIGTNLGYMWQREFSTSGNRSLHFLYLGFNFNFDRLKYNDGHQMQVAD